MRKTFLAVIVAASLAGCTSTQQAQLNAFTTGFIGAVQSFTANACKFVPEVSVIVALFNAGIATTIGGIATAICASIPPPNSPAALSLPRLGTGPAAPAGQAGGIVITGWRTR